MSSGPYRFGFVGCGPIARYHADVVRALGHHVHAVCTTTASPRRDAFVRDYGVVRAFERLEDLCGSDVDALVVAVPLDRTAGVVRHVAGSALPSLVEKPVALSADEVDQLLDQSPELPNRMLVGYNRRFYDFIPELRSVLAGGRLVSVSASFPDALSADVDARAQARASHGLAYVTSHGLDLLTHLVGELRVLRMSRQLPLPGGGHRAYDGLLSASNGRTPVHLQVHFDAPSQHELSFHFEDRIVRLSPMEKVTIYRGLDRLEPTPERPIHRYEPRVERSLEVDATYKPGFYSQMRNFVDTCVARTRPNTVGCTLPEAAIVLRLCEAIDGRRALAGSVAAS